MGDIFRAPGGIIVPSNNTFVNDTEVIGDKSIQAQIAQKCQSGEYTGSESVEEQLSRHLQNELSCAQISFEPIELNGNEYHQYEYGTLVPVTLQSKKANKNFYYLSMSRIDNPKVPNTTKLDLSESIVKMWKSTRKIVSDSSLASPVLATGSAKMYEVRAEVIARFILKSFYGAGAGSTGQGFAAATFPHPEFHGVLIDYLCKFPDDETELIKNPQSASIPQ